MSAIALQPLASIPSGDVIHTTLLELVRTVSEITDDESEAVAIVVSMLYTGRARLVGSFRDVPLEVMCHDLEKADA